MPFQKKPPGLSLHGVIWLPGPTPESPPVKKIAQRCGAGLGNVPGDTRRRQQIRAHVIPYDPKTAGQMARRAAFAAAMAEWAALSPAEKQEFNRQAKPLKISGVNLFVRTRTT